MIFLILNFFLHSPQAHAFTLITPGIKGYSNPEIAIDINTTSCPANVDLRQLVSDTIAVWNNVATSKLKLSIGAETTSTAAGYPPVAYCDNTLTGSTAGRGGSASNSSGVLVSGSLRINTNPVAPAAIFNLDSTTARHVIAHEIGHVLGLGHSEKDYALMNYTGPAVSELSLAQDDIDGITYLYPRDELSGDKPFGCGLVKDINYPPGTKMSLLLLFLFPLIISVILRKRKSMLY